MRVSPFRYLRINGYLLLPEAFRSLSRLSSALSAKASALRSFCVTSAFPSVGMFRSERIFMIQGIKRLENGHKILILWTLFQAFETRTNISNKATRINERGELRMFVAQRECEACSCAYVS